jgi:hypothetical protein
MFLNLELNEEEEKNFLAAKERTGIKSNTDFLRFLIKDYIFHAYGSMPSSKLKIIAASDINVDSPLFCPEEAEGAYRRGYVQGFCYGTETPRSKKEDVLDILNVWRHKISNKSMCPPDTFIREKLKDNK